MSYGHLSMVSWRAGWGLVVLIWPLLALGSPVSLTPLHLAGLSTGMGRESGNVQVLFIPLFVSYVTDSGIKQVT